MIERLKISGEIQRISRSRTKEIDHLLFMRYNAIKNSYAGKTMLWVEKLDR